MLPGSCLRLTLVHGSPFLPLQKALPDHWPGEPRPLPLGTSSLSPVALAQLTDTHGHTQSPVMSDKAAPWLRAVPPPPSQCYSSPSASPQAVPLLMLSLGGTLQSTSIWWTLTLCPQLRHQEAAGGAERSLWWWPECPCPQMSCSGPLIPKEGPHSKYRASYCPSPGTWGGYHHL